MDPYDMEPTPEEKQAALIQALKARAAGGQVAPPETPDVYRAWGNLAQMSGDRVLAPFGQSQVAQATQMDRGDGALLMKLLAGGKKNNINEANHGMELAVKDKFPDLWQKLQGQGLSDASWGKVYLQENANSRTGTAQEGADRRVHYTQEKTGERFQQHFGQVAQRQAADLGAREVYGASPLDPTNVKPISQHQAEDLQDQAAARDIVQKKGSDLLEIYKKPGALVPGTTANTELTAGLAAVLPQIFKTEAIGGMTKEHQELANHMVSVQPSEWKNFFNDKRLPTMIRDAMMSADSNVERRANSIGRTFKKGGNPAATPGSFKVGETAPASEEDKAAIQWARDNPTDPTAKEILQLHGLTK